MYLSYRLRSSVGAFDLGRVANMSTKTFAMLGQALDKASWDWLQQNDPEIAEGIVSAVGSGARATDIKSFVLRQTQRFEMSLRCEQAARHLEWIGQN